MRQRQKDFLMRLLPAAHNGLDDGLAAVIAVLIPQPLEDPTRRVSLLAMDLAVAAEDLFDDGYERVEFRCPLRRFLIPRRLTVCEHLFQGLPVHAVLATGRPLAEFAGQNPPPNFAPQFHVGDHPRHLSPPDSAAGNTPQ